MSGFDILDLATAKRQLGERITIVSGKKMGINISVAFKEGVCGVIRELYRSLVVKKGYTPALLEKAMKNNGVLANIKPGNIELMKTNKVYMDNVKAIKAMIEANGTQIQRGEIFIDFDISSK